MWINEADCLICQQEDRPQFGLKHNHLSPKLNETWSGLEKLQWYVDRLNFRTGVNMTVSWFGNDGRLWYQIHTLGKAGLIDQDANVLINAIRGMETLLEDLKSTMSESQYSEYILKLWNDDNDNICR